MSSQIKTPKFLERRWQFRFSVHFFRWGVHFKTRRGTTWRHLVIKATKGAAFGQRYGRRLLYIGWWQSRKGTKGNLNGWRIALAFDRLPQVPRESMNVPFFPLRPRDREREFEVR